MNIHMYQFTVCIVIVLLQFKFPDHGDDGVYECIAGVLLASSGCCSAIAIVSVSFCP